MRPTASTFQWGDDVHVFDLRLGEIRELEDKCKAGMFVVLDRLLRRQCFVDDIRETIRLGLIGGGKPASEAWRLVTRYVDERPTAENLLAATAILAAVAHGAPDATADEAAEANPTPAPATGDSTSPPSTAPAPSSASIREPSTASASGNGSPSSKAGTKRTIPSRKPSRRRSPSTLTASQG